MHFQNRSPTRESPLNIEMVSGRCSSYKQVTNWAFPSINPWLLQLEGRAQVPKLRFRFLMSYESRGDLIHWHSCEGNLFTGQKICEQTQIPTIYPHALCEEIFLSLNLPADSPSCSPSAAAPAQRAPGDTRGSPGSPSAPAGAAGAGSPQKCETTREQRADKLT